MSGALYRQKIRLAKQKVQEQIRRSTDQNNLYARGLAREGFLGGYEAALQDALAALDNIPPSRRPEFWEHIT